MLLGQDDAQEGGAEGAPQETSRRVLQACTTPFPCGSAVAGTLAGGIFCSACW